MKAPEPGPRSKTVTSDHTAAGQARSWFLSARDAMQAGRFEDAGDLLKKVIETDPDNPACHLALGRCLAELNQEGAAMLELEKGLALDPANIQARLYLAELLARTGDTNAACERLHEVLARDPANALAYYRLSELQPAAPNDPRISRIEQLLAAASHDPRDRSRLAFALAKLLDQCGEYRRAFHWFAEGNRLRHGQSGFDLEREAAYVAKAKRYFSAGLFASRPESGCRSHLPVFVVGMPRSGSTLVEQILSSHPEVTGIGESMLLPQAIAELPGWMPPGSVMPDAVAEIAPEAWSALGQKYLDAITALAPGASRIVDKQLFNYTLVGLIRLMLPQAKIIHCTRDPMATCWSCYATAFGRDRGFTWSLADLGKNYRLYQQLMAHWEAVIPGGLLEVSYEQLIGDFDNQVRRLLDHLGLPWSDSCREFYRTERSVRTSSKAQVRKPLYTGSLDHWKHYAEFLGPLKQALGED